VEWQHDLEIDRNAPPPEKLLGTKKLMPVGSKPEVQEIKYDIIDFEYKRKTEKKDLELGTIKV
jgi:hypothetical protein